ncbi:hypothetical protein MCUN1_003033 [Malassezia cuniculi]|uniref:Programmed cell death protein 2 C-terminal domain-containing protein n=1 Tax=Malassezia cuniculi TaxID=948313 RepID=A0AAF0F0Q1_9BASI|nr:hypothetical protein MCUN1_003033 [Malassezia cuniculi]
MSLDYDSDDELEYTNVHLGLADGPLEGDDEGNPLVSRLGGHAAWLPLSADALPPADVAACGNCGELMPLLVQIFAPLEGSAYDRCLYVWGCARAPCQRKSKSSVRAVRMLKFNTRWAAKLEKQRKREQERAARAAKEKEEEEKRKEKERVNPFAQAQNGGGLFGGGSLFDAPAAPAAPPAPTEEDSESDFDEDERLAEEMAIKASVAEQQSQLEDLWTASAPAYEPPQYLGTIPEPAEENKPAAAAPSDEHASATPTADPGESYEKMMLEGIDGTFERFVRRINPEPRQVVRYEFGGVPLPYSEAGALYRSLWTQDKFNGEVPPCKCGAPRVFELQLMPNLVNILRRETLSTVTSASTDEARRAEIESVLGVGSNADGDAKDAPQSGIAWTTAMVFVCSKDCVSNNDQGWHEEYVGVQFDGDI